MGRFTVVYLADAESELVDLWATDAERGRIAVAADLADQLLTLDPFGEAVYVGEELWRLDVSPLRFYFAIRAADRIVEISSVRRLPAS